VDAIKPTMSTMYAAIVIGAANDVVNPAAREVKSARSTGCRPSTWTKRTVFVFKVLYGLRFRSDRNPLFFKPNTRMLFGDANVSLHVFAELRSN